MADGIFSVSSPPLMNVSQQQLLISILNNADVDFEKLVLWKATQRCVCRSEDEQQQQQPSTIKASLIDERLRDTT